MAYELEAYEHSREICTICFRAYFTLNIIIGGHQIRCTYFEKTKVNKTLCRL